MPLETAHARVSLSDVFRRHIRHHFPHWTSIKDFYGSFFSLFQRDFTDKTWYTCIGKNLAISIEMVEVIPPMQYTEPYPLEKATARKCILIVENDDSHAALLREVISKGTSHHIFVASNAFAALKFVRHIIPHLLILNQSLPDMDSFELYNRLHTMKELRNVPTLMLGTQGPPIETDHCEVTCINRPFDSDMLITAIEALTNPPSEYFVHSFH